MPEPQARRVRDAVQQLEALAFLLRHVHQVGVVPIVGPGIAGSLEGIARNLLDALPQQV